MSRGEMASETGALQLGEVEPPSRQGSGQDAPGVTRVIEILRTHLEDPPTLHDMARVAIQSRFHFIRKFRRSTGIPPRQFLSALRLDTAKRLLLTTNRSVTDVCFDVGYNSLGTFITRFTHCVGVPPRALRQLVRTMAPQAPESTAHRGTGADDSTGLLISGAVADDPRLDHCMIFVGLFGSAIPQGRPVACAILRSPGPYRLGPAPAGRYYVMAAAVPTSATSLRYVLFDAALRARAGPVTLHDGLVAGDTTLVLRPPELTDPPILVALPAFLPRRSSHGAERPRSASAAKKMREVS